MIKLNKNQRLIIIIAMILITLVFIGEMFKSRPNLYQLSPYFQFVYIILMTGGVFILLEGKLTKEREIAKALIILACLFVLLWGITWIVHELDETRRLPRSETKIQWR